MANIFRWQTLNRNSVLFGGCFNLIKVYGKIELQVQGLHNSIANWHGFAVHPRNISPGSEPWIFFFPLVVEK